MIKAYGYTRVSTLEQAEMGDSIDTQTNKIKDFAKSHNIELLNIFSDLGVSGGIPPAQRPEMHKILLNLQAGNATGLIVCKIDRLSRSIKDFILLMDLFNKRSYEIFIINPEINTKTTYGKFTLNLLSIISELERDIIKERTREVLQNKKAKGERTGSIPFGKQLAEGSACLLEDHEEEQQTINIARELRQDVELRNGKPKHKTYKNICDELIRLERKNKDGNIRFYPSQIKRMLTILSPI